MPVDRFCNMDTIGTYANSGKIGLTGRTRKVDTTAGIRNRGIGTDVTHGLVLTGSSISRDGSTA